MRVSAESAVDKRQRCESLYRAELSDFLGLDMKKPEDVHPLFLMISQIPQGKSLSENRGSYVIDLTS